VQPQGARGGLPETPQGGAAEKEQLERSAQMFEMILRTAPDDIQNYLALKQIYYQLGREEDFKRVANGLAETYLAAGELEKAAREYGELLEIDPADEYVRNKLREMGYAGATLSFAEGKKSDPLLSGGRVHKETGSNAEAQRRGVGASLPPPRRGRDFALPPREAGPAKHETERVFHEIVQGFKSGGDGISQGEGEEAEEDQFGDEPVSPARAGQSRRLAGDDVGKALGAILVQHGLVTRQHLEDAIARQKNDPRPIGQILIESGYATEDDIINALVTQAGVPYLPLANYEISEEVAGSIPREVALKHNLMPVDKIAGTLLLAMAVPLNKEQKRELQQYIPGMKISYFISSWSDIKAKHERHYG